MAGREIARALATFELEEAGTSRTIDLSDDELLSLKEWTHKFRTKYEKVGDVSKAVFWRVEWYMEWRL